MITHPATRRSRRVTQAHGAIWLALRPAHTGGADVEGERALLHSQLLDAEAVVRRLQQRLARLH